jgi:hypothetical protein
MLGGFCSGIQSSLTTLQTENDTRKTEIKQDQQDIRTVLDRLDKADSDRATMQSDISWIRRYLEKGHNPHN